MPINDRGRQAGNQRGEQSKSVVQAQAVRKMAKMSFWNLSQRLDVLQHKEFEPNHVPSIRNQLTLIARVCRLVTDWCGQCEPANHAIRPALQECQTQLEHRWSLVHAVGDCLNVDDSHPLFKAVYHGSLVSTMETAISTTEKFYKDAKLDERQLLRCLTSEIVDTASDTGKGDVSATHTRDSSDQDLSPAEEDET